MLSTVAKQPMLPADAITSPAACYALRRIRANYASDCVRVRRADNTEQNFGFNAAGLLDVAAIETFAGGTDCRVVTWFDQSGNAANLTQATAANQPKLAVAGVVLKDKAGPYVLFDGGPTLSGTIPSVACNDLTWSSVMRINTTAGGFTFAAILSSGQLCFELRGYKENIGIWTRGTPGGSVSQLLNIGDVDACMLYSAPGITTTVGDGTDVRIYRNNFQQYNWSSVANIGAAGTTLTLGSTTATFSVSISELILYDRPLSSGEVSTLYDAINAGCRRGPLTPYPALQLQERLPWDSVFRNWMRSLKTEDIDVTVSTITWDGTYANTDQLYEIALTLGTAKYTDNIAGLLTHNRFWDLIAKSDGAGIEESASDLLRFFCTSTQGTPAPEWATWYAYSLPKAGGAEGNPFYHQRAVAVRALVQAMLLGIHYSKNVDQSQGFYAYSDFVGGAYTAVAGIFQLCRRELPLHVQNAFLDMFRYTAARQKHIGNRSVNANMEMKCVEMFAWIYTLCTDIETRTNCLEGAKQVLFSSPTGTPETAGTVMYSKAGHIREGRSPETTYNGQSLNHLLGALSLVSGDSNWSFLQTVVDEMLTFKGLQYFDEPDGTFDGPSGYAGRTGGSRVGEQGFETDTFACCAGLSTPGRPFHANLAAEATIVSSINSAITTANTRFASSMTPVTGTAACHTKGKDTLPVVFTAQNTGDTLTKANHGLIDGDAITLSNTEGGYPGGLAGNITYFVVNSAQNTFQVSLTAGGAVVPITSDGSATYRAAVWLTNAPNLAYAAPATTAGYLIGSYSGQAFTRYIRRVDDTNKLIWIDGSLSIQSASAVDYTIEYGPAKWVMTYLHWPSLPAKFPPAGYYSAQRARITGNDSTLKLPWEVSATLNLNRNDEFWFYKNVDSGSREFGFMVEGLQNKGAYSGWYGGTLQAFWTRDAGLVILARHDKSGSDVGQDENTRVFAEIETWATTHIYGVDSSGGKFSSGCTGENHLNAAATWNINGTPKSVVMENEFDNGVTEGFSASNITGTFVCRNTFQATAFGVRHLAEIEHTGTDNLLELWSVVPIYLRDSDQSMQDATIHYWNGSTWATVGTSLITASWVRIGRDFGAGVKYTWINFASPQAIKLSSAIWVQSYQGNARIRNLLIDLLGYTGSSKPFPATASSDYSITTIDPGLTPTGPSINVVYPAQNDVFPTNGVWAVQADVDWQGFTASSVTAEYTTNGTDWTSIGTLTLASGSTYRYLGGTIPASVQAVRVTATPTSGTPAVQQVAITSATATTVLHDQFTAANATAIGASYTAWTTNTTGNAYVVANGTLEVQSNAALGTNAHSWGNSVRLDVNSSRQLVEANIKPGTNGISPGIGLVSRMNAYYQGVIARVSTSTSTTNCFTLVDLGGSSQSVSASYASWDRANTYAIKIQAVGSVVVAQWFDIANGNALAATLAVWNLTNWNAVEYAGFVLDQNVATCDEFKVSTF